MIHHSEGLVAQSEQDHYLKLGTVSQLHVPKDMFLGYVINCEWQIDLTMGSIRF